MNKLFTLSLLLFLLLSCANSQTQEEQPSKPEPTSQKTTPTKTTTSPQKNNTIRESRSNTIRSTSRNKSEIKQAFPYNIDLKDATGKVLNSETLLKPNGKPTVLLFWLTTCYPCRIEMEAIHKKYAAWQMETDFNFVAISTDFKKNYEKFVERVEQKQFPWEMYNDVNREFRYAMPGGLNGLPQTFVIDKNGEVAYHKRKYSSGDEDILYQKVKELAKM